MGRSLGSTSTYRSQTITWDRTVTADLGGTTGTSNRIQSFNGISFSHDADGNVIQKYKAGVYDRKYWWSAEARLDSAQQDNWSKVKYDYDALGRPVRKWRGDPNGWVFDRLFVYDGDQLLVGLDQNMQRIDEYAYAPGIDRPIATIRGATGIDAVGYHVQDELGNIIGIVENGAYVSQTNSYDAWGTPTETGIAYNNRLRWKSLVWEGDVISLYYMRNRWYDYETGRFMSEDPIGLAGGINLYAFANNDPVNGWDPYGLDGCTAEYLAAGWYTVEIGGKEWCAQPLPTVEINARGGGGGGGGWSGRGGGWPRGGGDGGTWGGGGVSQTDATKVANPRAIAARSERLSCQRRAIITNTLAGAAVGRTVGAIVGLRRARQYATVGGLVGGIVASTAGPEAIPAGFYGGRIIGIGVAMAQDASVGSRFGGTAGLMYGVGQSISCNAPALPWENR